VQLVLLHDMIVIFVKQDERYVLKIHMSSNYPGKTERVVLRPVIKLNNLIIRANAADKKAIMLINMTSSNMYDLVCNSTEERKVWLHHITKAAEDYKSKQESRRTDFLPSASIPAVPDVDDKTKQSNELVESGEGSSEIEPSKDEASRSGTSQTDQPLGSSESMPGSSSSTMTSDLSSNGKLGASNGKGRSVSASPNPVRKVGEFLRVTETSPLIDPSEVHVIPRSIHFAQPFVSQYEELKRVDTSISDAFGEKMKLVSQLLHIPIKDSQLLEGEENPDAIQAKDLKELIIACFQEVDKLGRTIADQKVTTENFPIVKEQSGIQNALNGLLTQLLREVDRKEEELDVRRQELHRVREQNHGYQERLQGKSDKRLSSSSSSPKKSNRAQLESSPGPEQSEEKLMMTKTHSKPQLCVPVATSNSSNTVESTLPNNSKETLGLACEEEFPNFDEEFLELQEVPINNSSVIEAKNLNCLLDPNVLPIDNDDSEVVADTDETCNEKIYHEYENILEIRKHDKNFKKSEDQKNNGMLPNIPESSKT